MSENWQITMMSLFFTALLGILGWIGSQLMGIRKEFGAVVRKSDCTHDMESHCSLISELGKKVEQNSIDIAVLQQDRRRG